MAEGLRFECQRGCIACCEQKGFVYLTESDLLNIARFVGMTPAEFERRHVYRTGRRRRLRIPKEANCMFLRDGGCSVHEVKPVQCRIFPFWPELLDSRREWKKTARYCPGMGKGSLIQIEAAKEQAREMRESYPEMYA